MTFVNHVGANIKKYNNMNKLKINRVGEKFITNEGYGIEIIEYTNSHNCDVKILLDHLL